MIKLRPHHLLCILTYVGKGYTNEFVRNMDNVIARLNKGESILIVDSPDDICQPRLDSEQGHHCHCQRINIRDAYALEDIAKLIGKPLKTGDTLIINSHLLKQMRNAFKNNTIRKACFDCRWKEICDEVADKNFKSSQFNLN